MRTEVKRSAKQMTRKRVWRKRWMRAVSSLAAVTVFCTTYALILPAITASTATYCGHEEHKHTAGCYASQLICGLEEGEAQEATTKEVVTIVKEEVLVDEGHAHDADCYITETVLTCNIDEVEAQDAVIDEETGEVIEEAVEGHTHGDDCYEVIETLVCEEEEREAVYEEVEKEVVTEEEVPAEEAHKHTSACYDEKALTCKIEEHEHEELCFSNKNADLENAAAWEKTLPKQNEMTGEWREDTLTVAKSQLGYKESAANFNVQDGERKGYTRYGAMFGIPYGDWCGMFLQFSMHYAGVPKKAMAGSPSVPTWVKDAKEAEQFQAAGEYTPQAGDIIFFDWDHKDSADHVGIVEEVELNKDGELVKVITIEGNSSNSVRRNTYRGNDSDIYGYAVIPDTDENIVDEEEAEEAEEETEATEEVEVPATGEEGTLSVSGVTANGEGYTVNLTYSADANIPEGAYITADEVREGTASYTRYVDKTIKAIEAETDAENVYLAFARFFDITIHTEDGTEIEPAAPVEVRIAYDETIEVLEDQNLKAVHFAESGIELIEAEVVEEAKTETTDVVFVQDSFSVTGTVVSGFGGSATGSDGQESSSWIEGKLNTSHFNNYSHLPVSGQHMIIVSLNNTNQMFALGIKNGKKIMTPVTKVGDRVIFPADVTDASPYYFSFSYADDRNFSTITNGSWSAQYGYTEGSDNSRRLKKYEYEGYGYNGRWVSYEAAWSKSGSEYNWNIDNTYIGTTEKLTVNGFVSKSDVQTMSNQPGGINVTDSMFPTESGKYVIVVQKPTEPNKYYALGTEANGTRILTEVKVENGKVIFENEDEVSDLAKYEFYYQTKTETEFGGHYISGNYLVDNNGKPLSPYYVRYDSSNSKPYIGDTLTTFGTDSNYTNSLIFGERPKTVGYNGYTYTAVYNVGYDQEYTTGSYYVFPYKALPTPYYYLVSDKTGTTAVASNYTWKDGDAWGFGKASNPNQIKNNMLRIVNFSTLYGTDGDDYEGTGNTGNGISDLFPTKQDLGTPGHSKDLTSNGDGTYTLALDVTGKTYKESADPMIDVVIVMDKSNSMTLNKTDGRTRLAVAQEEANKLVNTLFSSGLDINIGLVTFGTRVVDTHSLVAKSGQSRLNSIINKDIPGGWDGATNWEAALAKANELISYNGPNNERKDAMKYVIFITDGDPTVYNNRQGFSDEKTMAALNTSATAAATYTDVYESGREDARSIARSYRGSKDEARLIASKADFYTIGIFGDVQNLRDLTAYAYSYGSVGTHPDGHYAHASNKDALNQILNSIAQNIMAEFSYCDVVIDDGLTNLTGHALVEGSSTNFTYYKYSGKEPWVAAGLGEDDTTPFSALPENIKRNYAWNIDAETYTWTDGGKEHTETVGKAKLVDGHVIWELGNRFKLENDTTYEVEFTVWPSQEAYDWIEKLNNGTVLPVDIPSAVQEQILQMPDGKFYLRTNEEYPTLDWRQVVTVGAEEEPSDVMTATYTNPDPIVLTTTKIEVEKIWKDVNGNVLTTDEVNALIAKHVIPQDGININLMRNDSVASNKANGTVATTVNLNPENNWKAEVWVAPGLMISDPAGSGITDYSSLETTMMIGYQPSGKFYILENGHNYWLDETTEIEDVTWSSEDTIHPMLEDSSEESGIRNAIMGSPEVSGYTYTGSNEKYDAKLTGTNTVTVKSYELKLVKIETGKESILLGGAEFELYTDAACTEKATDVDGNEIGTITTGTAGEMLGKANIGAVEAGTYYLKETKAPNGYIQMVDVVTITINADGTVTINQQEGNGATIVGPNDENVITLTVPNSAGVALPNTGGAGTTIYTMAGLVLMVVALVSLMYRRNLKRKEVRTRG